MGCTTDCEWDAEQKGCIKVKAKKNPLYQYAKSVVPVKLSTALRVG